MTEKQRRLKQQIGNMIVFCYKIIHPIRYRNAMEEMNKIIDTSKEWI